MKLEIKSDCTRTKIAFVRGFLQNRLRGSYSRDEAALISCLSASPFHRQLRFACFPKRTVGKSRRLRPARGICRCSGHCRAKLIKKDL